MVDCAEPLRAASPIASVKASANHIHRADGCDLIQESYNGRRSGFAQGLAYAMANAILSLSADPLHVFFLINVTVLICGMFLDAASIMVILGPLFYKVGTQIGIDPVHLGIVLTVNGAIGMFTPPFGLNLFVASSLGAVSYEQAVRGSLPFIGLAIVALAIITYVPEISMWLPRTVYPGL